MCDEDETKTCGCDNLGGGDKRKRCACRGSESFERWKMEMLENGKNGPRQAKVKETIDCSCFRKDKKKKEEACGCTCCGFFFCAAALIALGVGAAWVKKKYID